MTFFSLINPFRSKVIFILVCIFLSNLLALALPWGIKIIIDDVLVEKNLELLNFTVIVLLAVLLVRSRLNFLRNFTSRVVGEKVICRLRERMYHHVHRMSLGGIQKLMPSQIMTRMTGDLDSLRRFLFGDAIDCIYGALSIGLIFLMLGFINLKLTLVSVLCLPLFIRMYVRMIPQLKDHYRRLRDIWAQLTARVNEVLQGMATVRAFTAENHERGLLWDQQKKIIRAASQAHGLNAKLWVLVELFSTFGLIAILWIGGQDVIAGRMSTGELIAFYSYLGMLFSPLIRIVVINNSYQEAAAALDRINEIMNLDDRVYTVPSPIKLSALDGRVAFKDVYFGYTKDEDVLKGISFTIEKGETMGIVGVSGAGKTTLINLLLRFYDPRRGEITVDGNHLQDLDLCSYRRELGVVLQDDFLFNGSIKENICYGRFEAPEKDMIEVAKIAHIHEFITQLPDGYETKVGERGLNLSSGQRQRIAIARALLRDPSILILDEATSAVDALTENAIQKSVRQFMQGRTMIVIAHRFSTIMEADQIIVLDQGKIVEKGRHNYLLKREGFYSTLYFEQFKEKDANPLAEI